MVFSPSFGLQCIGILSSKYRPLFVPLQVVLLFDIALLVVNFRISAQLEELSVQINVAGPQHMLSRQLPKAILMVERQVLRETPKVLCWLNGG